MEYIEGLNYLKYAADRGLLSPNRQNVDVSSVNFSLPDSKPFIIFTTVSGKIKCTTQGGQTDTFDFLPGDDTAIYTEVHVDAENTITSFSVKYF